MDLKSIRSKLGLTQAEAAALVGVTVTTWCRWETGKHEAQGRQSDMLAQMQAAAATKPCYFSPNMVLTNTVILSHVEACPWCFLAWAKRLGKGGA